MSIHHEGHERADIGKGVESVLLIRFQDGRHGTSLHTHLCQEIGCHRLAIHNEVGQMHNLGGLLVTGEHLRNALGQMPITTMCGRKQWMPLVVMQEGQCTAAQDFA